MTRLCDVPFVPTSWARKLEEELWINTCRELLSASALDGGLERLARTLGAEVDEMRAVVVRVSEELEPGYDASPSEARAMGLVPDSDLAPGTES